MGTSCRIVVRKIAKPNSITRAYDWISPFCTGRKNRPISAGTVPTSSTSRSTNPWSKSTEAKASALTGNITSTLAISSR